MRSLPSLCPEGLAAVDQSDQQRSTAGKEGVGRRLGHRAQSSRLGQDDIVAGATLIGDREIIAIRRQSGCYPRAL